MTAPARFWSKVGPPEHLSKVPDYTDCWPWLAATVQGYGSFRLGKKQVKAHRFAYELLVGPIPEGLQLDHLCRVRHCVNPSHLEPVTSRVNVLRSLAPTAENATKTHCGKGHLFDEANTYVNRRGGRQCRECRRECQRTRERRAKNREQMRSRRRRPEVREYQQEYDRERWQRPEVKDRLRKRRAARKGAA